MAQNNQSQQKGDSKALVGFVSAFFLGIWGILIGIFCFKEGSYERKSFHKGFWWTIGLTWGLAIASVVVTVVIIFLINFIILSAGAVASTPVMI